MIEDVHECAVLHLFWTDENKLRTGALPVAGRPVAGLRGHDRAATTERPRLRGHDCAATTVRRGACACKAVCKQTKTKPPAFPRGKLRAAERRVPRAEPARAHICARASARRRTVVFAVCCTQAM